MDRALGRSPTFLVGAERQRGILDDFQRREQQLSEAYCENKPLCFNARAFQKTHPVKAREGHRDADVTLSAPLILGVADGVSQVEDFGIDASLLPKELMKQCEEVGMRQLVAGAMQQTASASSYRGPIPLMREAWSATKSLGSTTAVLAVLDNSTRIHSKLHPMIAVITIGDCELIILRRLHGTTGPLQVVFHTEMQRIDGHAQTPLQLARVDGRIDANFDERITLEVIERGSAVHCVSAYEGDIVVMGSDGVFDNLYEREITDLCNAVLLPGQPVPSHDSLLSHLSRCIIEACHMKSERGPNGQMPDSPIGAGGKMDDTSIVVGEVIAWSAEHSKNYSQQPAPISIPQPQKKAAAAGKPGTLGGPSQQRELAKKWKNPLSQLLLCGQWQNCCVVSDSDDTDLEESDVPDSSRTPYPVHPAAHLSAPVLPASQIATGNVPHPNGYAAGPPQIAASAPILDLRHQPQQGGYAQYPPGPFGPPLGA